MLTATFGFTDSELNANGKRNKNSNGCTRCYLLVPRIRKYVEKMTQKVQVIKDVKIGCYFKYEKAVSSLEYSMARSLKERTADLSSEAALTFDQLHKQPCATWKYTAFISNQEGVRRDTTSYCHHTRQRDKHGSN